MAKKTRKKQYAAVGQLARIDYLLSDAYEAPKLSVVTGEQKNTKTGKTVQEGTGYYTELERHRLMSDTTIKYFYEKGSNIIHDKSCWQARQIPLEQLCTSEEYLPEMVQCPECMKKAYIRAGGKASELNEYLQFFRKADVNEELMRRLFIENQAETELAGNSLTIRMKDENWIWRITDERKHLVEMLHNQFKIHGKKRVLEPGFYTVFPNVHADKALLFMESYNWEGSRQKFSLVSFVKKTMTALALHRENLGKKLKMIRNAFSLQESRHVYYIDGDNCPCERMRGMELLAERDIVMIYHVRTGSYYTHQRRASIRDRYVCNVKFIPVNPGSNATDFAIGLDAYDTLLHHPKTKVHLISGDKHFDVITTQIKALLGQRAYVERAGCVREVRR